MPDIAPDGFVYYSPGRRVDPQSGQLYTREEDPEFRRYIDYLGYSPERAAEAMGYDPNDQNTWGRWVQGTDKPDTFYKTLGLFLAGAGLGGLGGGYLAPFIGGAAGGGAAGGAAGAGAASGGAAAAGGAGAGIGGGVAAAAPSLGIAGGTALPASLVTSTAVPGFAAGTAAGAGATAAGAGSGLGGGGAAGGTAAATTPTLTASTGIPAGTALPGAVPGAASGGGTLGTLRNLYGKYGDYAKTGLKVANDIEQGRSADRAQQNQYAALDDALARNTAILNAQAPAQFSRQVVLGDILANLQPFTYDNKTGAMSGGLGPWVLGPNSRASGQALSKSALDHQLSDNPYNLPAPTPRKTGGKVDTALNILGTAGEGLDAYDAIRADRTKQSQYAQLLDIFGRRPGPNVAQPGPAAPRQPTVTAPDDDPYAPLRPRTRQPVSDPYQYLQPARG